MTQDEKDRILTEERFRAEARQAIGVESAAPKTLFGRSIAFFNTALGIWVLSSVLLTIVTGLYGVVRDHFDDTRRVRVETRQIDLEITHRLEVLSSALQSILDTRGQDKAAVLLVASFDSSSGNDFVFPEYASSTMGSLLLRLSNDLDSNDAKPIMAASEAWQRISAQKASAFGIVHAGSVSGAELSGRKYFPPAFKMLTELRAAFHNKRWKLSDGAYAVDISANEEKGIQPPTASPSAP